MQALRAKRNGWKQENDALGASARAKIQASRAKAMQKPIFSTVTLMRKQIGAEKRSLGTLPGDSNASFEGKKYVIIFVLAF